MQVLCPKDENKAVIILKQPATRFWNEAKKRLRDAVLMCTPAGENVTTINFTNQSKNAAVQEKNLRLNIIQGNAEPKRPENREEALLYLAWTAIHKADCVLYGGFIRDYIVRGESANDVDTSTCNVDGSFKIIKAALEEVGMHFVKEFDKGQAKTKCFNYPGQGNENALELDMCDPRKLVSSKPDVDCDAGNLQISLDAGLSLKVPKMANFGFTLAQTIEHCHFRDF